MARIYYMIKALFKIKQVCVHKIDSDERAANNGEIE